MIVTRMWQVGVLRNFPKFTGKHLCQSLFFKTSKNTFSYITPPGTASVYPDHSLVKLHAKVSKVRLCKIKRILSFYFFHLFKLWESSQFKKLLSSFVQFVLTTGSSKSYQVQNKHFARFFWVSSFSV